MHCGFQHSALYHCGVHLSCHFESFISECTSASVTRTVDLPFKNGHSTHSLSLCSYFKLYFSARLYFTYPSLRILHAYIWTDAAKQIPRQNVICGPSRLHVRMENDNFMHNLSSFTPSSIPILLLLLPLPTFEMSDFESALKRPVPEWYGHEGEGDGWKVHAYDSL